MQAILFYCKVTLYASDIFRTHHQEAASGTGHNIGAATVLQRGQVRTQS
jgi:hypothetical protein